MQLDLVLVKEARRCMVEGKRFITPDVQHWFFHTLHFIVGGYMLDVRIQKSYDVTIKVEGASGKIHRVKVPFAWMVDRDRARVARRVDRLITKARRA